MFRITMLPARHGDALWIEYGDEGSPRRILVDGGPTSRSTADRIRGLLEHGAAGEADHDLELMVVTHIDADHIAGILGLLEDRTVYVHVRDLWFNGWRHLPTDRLGAKQAEALGAAIVRRRLPWNGDFGGEAVMVPDQGPLPVVELPGGMRLTLLSPTREALADLRPVWEREVREAGLVPGHPAEQAEARLDRLGDTELDPDELASEPFEDDRSEANLASIAMLAEFEGSSLLLTGDAGAAILADGLRRLAAERAVDRIEVDAFKLPHHGSRHNVSGEVLDLVECDRFLISTNGDIFGHPDPVAVSRVITRPGTCTLAFNHRTDTTERWDSSRLRRRFGYETVYPGGDAGLTVDV